MIGARDLMRRARRRQSSALGLRALFRVGARFSARPQGNDRIRLALLRRVLAASIRAERLARAECGTAARRLVAWLSGYRDV